MIPKELLAKILVWCRYGAECVPKSLQLSVKLGRGSVMDPACISARGVGDLVKIDVIMNAEN